MSEIQDEYREYKKLCRVEDDPGVAGLAQLGRNAIERVRQLERERDELRAGLERLAQLYEDEHDLCDRPMWLQELIARPKDTTDRLRADAERYRVIRDWPNRDNLELAIVSRQKCSMFGASLDRVVDAARGVK